MWIPKAFNALGRVKGQRPLRVWAEPKEEPMRAARGGDSPLKNKMPAMNRLHGEPAQQHCRPYLDSREARHFPAVANAIAYG